MSEPAPYVGAMVHFMAGDLDCAAIITHLDYRVSVPPDEPQLSLPIVLPPFQALLVLSAMQQPFWTAASYSAGAEVGTWHWPSLHDPPVEPEPPEPEPLPYSGAIVHCADKVNLHMPAIVCFVYPDEVTIDAAVMNSSTDKVEFVTAVPKLSVQQLPAQTDKDELTWHWPEDPNAPPVREPKAEE